MESYQNEIFRNSVSMWPAFFLAKIIWFNRPMMMFNVEKWNTQPINSDWKKCAHTHLIKKIYKLSTSSRLISLIIMNCCKTVSLRWHWYDDLMMWDAIKKKWIQIFKTFIILAAYPWASTGMTTSTSHVVGWCVYILYDISSHIVSASIDSVLCVLDSFYLQKKILLTFLRCLLIFVKWSLDVTLSNQDILMPPIYQISISSIHFCHRNLLSFKIFHKASVKRKINDLSPSFAPPTW